MNKQYRGPFLKLLLFVSRAPVDLLSLRFRRVREARQPVQQKYISLKEVPCQRGVVTLATTVVIFFVALVLVLSVQFLGVGELLIGFEEGKSEQAFEFADSCVDEAVLRVKRNNSYTGGTLSLEDASCTIVVSGGGSTRTIDVSATVGTITRKIQTVVTITGSPFSHVSWEENTN